ncbi:MAG: cell division protein FtsW [Omnitrophica bacterium RIFCSPLOWO2_01_FULL_50_24]|nr:MAG: cell division protein FtsW [Omnitrophica bacterium RIFCSPLOWO2_01_FULL_50_24]
MYALIAIGVVMIYSASAVLAELTYRQAAYFLWRQLFAIVVGTAAFSFCSSLHPEQARRHSRLLIGIAIIFLVLVLLPYVGYSAGGARRWLRFPFFSFQPVEYVKLAVCIYLADYLTRKRKVILEGSAIVFVPPSLLLLTVGCLILAQPDLGSCFFLLMISGIMFFLSGIRFWYIALVGIFAAAGFVLLIVRAPYRLHRVIAYLDPWKDPQGNGFQIIQSFLAFGLGGFKGVGLGQSTQKLFYLPQSHTDFIFSIIGEELGFVGTSFVVILYLAFFILGYRMAKRCREPFLRLFAFSLVMLVVLEALMNLLVATGMIPTKGLPLPFISYGGTAIVFHMAAVGLLVAVDREASRYARE